MVIGDKIKCIKSYANFFLKGKFYTVHCIYQNQFVVIKSHYIVGQTWREHFYFKNELNYKTFSDYFEENIKLERKRKLLKIKEDEERTK